MVKRYLLIPFLAILVGVFLVGYYSNDKPSEGVIEGISYHGVPCISTTGKFEGRESALGEMELVGCSHNVLYDSGKEEVYNYLAAGTGGNDAFDFIELCDAAIGCDVPTAGKLEDYTAHAADGLSVVEGTVDTNPTDGNWSVWTEFTSTGDNQLTNVTRLQNSAGDDLAGNYFTLVTLQTDDKLLINYTVWVE